MNGGEQVSKPAGDIGAHYSDRWVAVCSALVKLHARRTWFNIKLRKDCTISSASLLGGAEREARDTWPGSRSIVFLALYKLHSD